MAKGDKKKARKDEHREEIRRLIEQITAYLRDATRKRPLNALMLAAPGAGKSHFIRQLAVAMKSERVQAVTFNMATMQSTETTWRSRWMSFGILR